MHFVVTGDAGEDEAIEDEGVGVQVAFVDHHPQLIHRSHLLVMRVLDTQTRHGESAFQLHVRDVIQTAVHM